MVIGASNKADIETKLGLGIGISLLLSFLAGMMVSNIKIIIAEKAPLINKINPVALISDGIYSLYYYQSLDRYYNNLICLVGVTLGLILLTFILSLSARTSIVEKPTLCLVASYFLPGFPSPAIIYT